MRALPPGIGRQELGFTVQGLLGGWLGNESSAFVTYHIKVPW